ncbi:unnamed protein product [Boreogadus saida]
MHKSISLLQLPGCESHPFVDHSQHNRIHSYVYSAQHSASVRVLSSGRLTCFESCIMNTYSPPPQLVVVLFSLAFLSSSGRRHTQALSNPPPPDPSGDPEGVCLMTLSPEEIWAH